MELHPSEAAAEACCAPQSLSKCLHAPALCPLTSCAFACSKMPTPCLPALRRVGRWGQRWWALLAQWFAHLWALCRPRRRGEQGHDLEMQVQQERLLKDGTRWVAAAWHGQLARQLARPQAVQSAKARSRSFPGPPAQPPAGAPPRVQAPRAAPARQQQRQQPRRGVHTGRQRLAGGAHAAHLPTRGAAAAAAGGGAGRRGARLRLLWRALPAVRSEAVCGPALRAAALHQPARPLQLPGGCRGRGRIQRARWPGRPPPCVLGRACAQLHAGRQGAVFMRSRSRDSHAVSERKLP